jgi:hypothetical protein
MRGRSTHAFLSAPLICGKARFQIVRSPGIGSHRLDYGAVLEEDEGGHCGDTMLQARCEPRSAYSVPQTFAATSFALSTSHLRKLLYIQHRCV